MKFNTAPMAVMEFAAVAERDLTAGEYAPGGSWEVLIARKADVLAVAA